MILLQRYIFSLVLENKVSQAINLIKNNKNKQNTIFLMLIFIDLDSLKRNNLDEAQNYLKVAISFSQNDRFLQRF